MTFLMSNDKTPIPTSWLNINCFMYVQSYGVKSLVIFKSFLFYRTRDKYFKGHCTITLDLPPSLCHRHKVVPGWFYDVGFLAWILRLLNYSPLISTPLKNVPIYKTSTEFYLLTNLWYMDAKVAMDTRTFYAYEDAKVQRCPVWVWGPAIGTFFITGHLS